MKKILTALLIASAAFTACNKDDDNNNTNTLNQTDRNFMMQAAYGNNAEISAGQLAATKGTNLAVRSYGEMMVTDHTTANADLASLATQTGVTLPTGLDSMHQALAQQLMVATGHTFDSLYISSQIMDHQIMRTLMQTELSSGSDQRVKNYAQKYLPKIEMHHHMADSIKAGL